MPSAGAIVPPLITPLRPQIPGKPASHIDTATYLELETDTPDCKIYFSTDGSKPNPFQLKVGGRETTFKYKGPFTLKAGKRTLKAIAVSRDGLHESNVVTRTFVVDENGPPPDDLDSIMSMETINNENSLRRSGPAISKRKKTLRNSTTKISPKEAWASSDAPFDYVVNGNTPTAVSDSTNGGPTANSVNLPDGPFNPTNHSGTQVNFWGVAPGNLQIPGANQNQPYGMSYPNQLGYMTNQMLQGTNQQRVSMSQLKELIAAEAAKHQTPPLSAIEYKKMEPELKAKSPGGGDWKAQIEHIYAHLIEQCKTDYSFRTAIGDPKLGKIVQADFDEEDDAFLLTVSIAKPGRPSKAKLPIKLTEKSQAAGNEIKKKMKKEEPKPKPPKKTPPKKEPPAKPKDDPYYETEEYEPSDSEQSSSEESFISTPPKRKPSQPPTKPPVKKPPVTKPPAKKPPATKPPATKPPATKPPAKKPPATKPPSTVKPPAKKPPSTVKPPAKKPQLSDDEESDGDKRKPPKKQSTPKGGPPKEPPKAVSKPDPPEEDWPRHWYYETEEYEAEGTLKAWPAFDAEADSEKIRKAMKGLGTDEKAIIDVLGYRNSVQRTEVVTMFKTMFGKDLVNELKGETSGDFKETLKALCLPPDEYDASEIKRAIKGLGTDEDALIEILCTRTNAQITTIREKYKKMFGKQLEEDVKGDTSGHFKRLLVSQIQANREENPTFDRTAAKEDAEALYKAGEAKWGTDESKFNEILCQRSFPHLRAVFEEYGNFSKKDIEDAIKSEFSGDIKNGLLTVVRVIRDKPTYFARKLQKAMKGLGTDDKALIRIVVSRSECDMVQIKEAFEKEFEGTLAEWIIDDTSGDYKEILLALVGDRPAPVLSAEEIAEAEAEPEIEEVEEEEVPQEGTLTPADPFDSKNDSEILRKAMKGLGTDEKAIINVMAKRSSEQRQEIVTMFKTMYGKDLVKELKSETSGSFKDTLVGLCQTPTEFDASQLRKAMKGLGTDEDCLIEILCTRTNEELAAIVETYKKLHNRKLEEDIISETSGHTKRLLVSMLQANRPEGNTVDRRKARKDAKDLFDAGENKFGTDESRFNVILCSRSYPQLRATFEEFSKLAGKDIADSIKSEMSGDLKKGMLTIVGCIRSKATQFAKTIHDALSGLGTDDDKLVRTVVSRAEVDMVQIKEEFEKNYKQNMGKFIADDISGDYKRIILALVDEEGHLKK